MLEGIYTALSLVIFVLALSYLFYITLFNNKHERKEENIVRILFFSILFILFIFETIIASILGQSQLIILNIFCVIITAVYTIYGFFALKKLKEKQLNA